MFKVGDIIEMTSDCGDIKKGKRFKLVLYNGELYADYDMPSIGCSCQYKWKLVTRLKKEIKEFGIVKFMRETNANK